MAVTHYLFIRESQQMERVPKFINQALTVLAFLF